MSLVHPFLGVHASNSTAGHSGRCTGASTTQVSDLSDLGQLFLRLSSTLISDKRLSKKQGQEIQDSDSVLLDASQNMDILIY